MLFPERFWTSKLSNSLMDFSVIFISWMEECLVELLSVEIMDRSYVCVMNQDGRLIILLRLSTMHQFCRRP